MLAYMRIFPYLCTNFDYFNKFGMKASYYFAMLTIGATALMVGCTETPSDLGPGDNSHNQDSIYVAPDPIPDPDVEGVEVPEDAITVNEALKIGAELGSGNVSEQVYHIKGFVTHLGEKNADGIASYGNATFYIAANRQGSTKEFYAFQVMGKDGQKLMDVSQVEVGDFVVIEGKISNYNGIIETESKGAAHIYSSSNPFFDPADPEPTPDPEGANVPEGALNVYEALEIGKGLASGATTPQKYYVKGYVSRFDAKHESGMSSYGNGTFYIAANKEGMVTKEFEAYQVYGRDGKPFDKSTQMDAVQVGDFVVIYGYLTNYNGTIETTGKGAAYVYYSTNPKW